jgi:hypothetical protein
MSSTATASTPDQNSSDMQAIVEMDYISRLELRITSSAPRWLSPVGGPQAIVRAAG